MYLIVLYYIFVYHGGAVLSLCVSLCSGSPEKYFRSPELNFGGPELLFETVGTHGGTLGSHAGKEFKNKWRSAKNVATLSPPGASKRDQTNSAWFG